MLRLPKAAAAILSRIEIENEQHLARRRTNRAIIRDLKERRAECETRLAIAEQAYRAGNLYRETATIGEAGAEPSFNRVADDTALTRERDEIASIDSQIAKLEESDTTPRATAIKLRAELDPHVKYISVMVNKGDASKSALASKRAAIDAKREERKAVANASRTYEEVREAAMSSIRSMAARGVPKVLPAYEGRAIEWPQAQVPNPGSNGFAFVPDGAALVAYLFQSELEKKVDSLLDFYRDDAALSEVEQRAKLELIDDELITLYREEAAIVEAMVADGRDAYHLADRPAVAVLGIRLA